MSISIVRYYTTHTKRICRCLEWLHEKENIVFFAHLLIGTLLSSFFVKMKAVFFRHRRPHVGPSFNVTISNIAWAGTRTIYGLAAQTLDPRFAPGSPRIVPIRTLRITFGVRTLVRELLDLPESEVCGWALKGPLAFVKEGLAGVALYFLGTLVVDGSLGQSSTYSCGGSERVIIENE